ncbi:hypothetical protein UFOVP1365_8 [uncultured Caudovirales phage]|uniref:Uncharacterized protein n=1 Tax=uncultured Caudovirales phage TaxID=2100421 RepID=A0A6J5RWQ7_9CAUD|nr:hypothetical protein UFOVP1365_8 [uncultured Caudovirales phage]
MEADKPEVKTSVYDTVEYWFRWLRASKKAARQHWEESCKAWAEYENRQSLPASQGSRSETDVGRVYPIYWASCKTMEPAYYSRIPKITTEKEFDINDDVANTMCLIIERLGKNLVSGSNFDHVFATTVQDYIHADKATTQIVYEAQFEKKLTTVNVTTQDGVTFIDDKGEPVEDEIKQDPQTGAYFAEREQEVAIPETQKIYLSPCCYDEILHTPEAKIESEIKDKAYHFCMTQEEAEQRFLGEDGKPLPVMWKEGRAGGSDESGKSVDEIEDKTLPLGRYVEGWEIYCKKTKSVYWVSEQYKDGFLDKKEDPYGFRNFFPSPAFVIGSKPSKSLYPTPAFIHLLPTLKQLHSSYSKVFELIRGTRRRAIINGANPDLILALNSLESGEFISAKDLQNLLGPGGKLADLIFFVPVQEFVAAIGELVSLEATFDEHFSQWFGVPDILRGIGDPVETAAAQQIKQGAAHDRFKLAKKQIAQLARDSIEMMVDLALAVYDDNKIARICGYQYMKPEEQQMFPQALAALRNDEERVIRVDIETDSLAFIDQTMRQQQRNLVSQTITMGLREIANLSQTNPEFVPTAMRVLLASIDGMEGGKEFESEVKQAVQELMNKITAPQPEVPPPPDYEAMKMEVESRKVAILEQEFQLKLQTIPIEHNFAQQKIELENKKQDLEYQIKDLNTQLKAVETTANSESKKSEQEIKAVKEAFSQQLESAYLKLEQVTSMLKIKEQYMEEDRLRNQQLTERMKEISVSSENSSGAATAKPPVIHIHNESGAKKIVMKRGKNGELVGTTSAAESSKMEDSAEGESDAD